MEGLYQETPLKSALERLFMVYTELTIKAMKLAYNAHRGQFDRGGIPYVFHPIHLAEQMDDEMAVCVALLHDVVEDTDVSLEKLAAEFPSEVVIPVSYLTRTEGVTYMDYVRRLSENPVAVKVKLADLMHNMDESRLSGERLPAYLKKRYEEAFAFLQSLEQ